MKRIAWSVLFLVITLMVMSLAGCEAIARILGLYPVEFKVEYVEGGYSEVREESTVEIGDLEYGSTVDRTFRLTNEGKSTFEVTDVSCDSYVGNAFSLVPSENYHTEVEPGSYLDITVRFAPEPDLESFTATVSIGIAERSNGYWFDVRGTAFAPTVYEPNIVVYDVMSNELVSWESSIFMGEYFVGDPPQSAALPVRNEGNGTLTISSVVCDPPGGITYALNDYVLDPGEETTLNVTAITTTAGSPVGCTISIFSDDPDTGEFGIGFWWMVYNAF